MKLAGWTLLPSVVIGTVITFALIARALPGGLRPMPATPVADDITLIKLALVPAWIGGGLSICGLVLLAIAYRTKPHGATGFPIQ